MNPISTAGEMCAYHPNRPAADRCTECASAICSEDRTVVAGKTVCQACVQAIRARVAAQMADTQTPPPYNLPASSEPFVPAPSLIQSIDSAAPPASIAEPGNLLHLLSGVAAGVVVGIIGAFIYDKFVFFTHIQFGLISSLIGWAVGVAIVTIGRRTGWLPAVLGGLIAFSSMVLSYQLLMNDELGKAGYAQRLPFSPLGALFTVTHLEIMDWVFIAFGVYGAVKVALRTTRR